MMGVMTMIIMLIVLVPLAILFAWAMAQDLRRRRRHSPAVDVESRATLKASTEAGIPKAPGGSNSGGGL